MARFLLIYRADPAAMAAMGEPTPEEGKAMMDAWWAWHDRVGDAMVDFGAPTMPASPGADPGVGGYSVVEAASAEAVEPLLEGHPHRASGGTVDVYSLVDMSGA